MNEPTEVKKPFKKFADRSISEKKQTELWDVGRFATMHTILKFTDDKVTEGYQTSKFRVLDNGSKQFEAGKSIFMNLEEWKLFCLCCKEWIESELSKPENQGDESGNVLSDEAF